MAEDQRRPFVSASEAGAALATPARGQLTFKAHAEQTGGELSAFESNIAPGEGPPLHAHVREDELLYVVEGRLRVRLEESIHEAAAGSLVFIPRGVPHTWQNVGDTRARFFGVFTPASAGMERFFERAAELPDDTRADAFRTLAGDAGMEVLGPPLAESHPLAGGRLEPS